MTKDQDNSIKQIINSLDKGNGFLRLKFPFKLENLNTTRADFLDLSNNNFMKNRPASSNPIRTASSWQVRQPVYKSSLNRINNYKEELEPLISIFKKYPELINLD